MRPDLHLLRQRPGDPPGAGGQIQNRFAALERQRLDQLDRQLAAHIRQAALVELRGMSRIFEARFVIVGMAVIVPMFLFMPMIRTVRVLMPMRFMPMIVAVRFMRMTMIMFVVMMLMAMFLPMRMFALMLVLMFVSHLGILFYF